MYILMTQSQYDSRTTTDYTGVTKSNLDGDMHIVQLASGTPLTDSHTQYFIGKDEAQKYMYDNSDDWVEDLE